MKRIFRARDYDPDPDRDLAEELQSHLDLMVEDLVATGMTETEARAEAERRLGTRRAAHLGAAPQARSRHRRRRLLDRMDAVRQDLRYAIRRMGRAPGFTAMAILSLGIGIGANTAVFTAVNSLLIQNPPFRAPEELVRIYTGTERREDYRSTAFPDFREMQAMDDVFTAVGAWETQMAVAELGETPRRVLVEAVSANLFPMLGLEPALGRNFSAEEDAPPGEHPVVILGHGFWQQAFGGDPHVLGRTLSIAGQSFTVVGVAPAHFNSMAFSGFRMDVFVPLAMGGVVSDYSPRSYENRRATRYEVQARLAPGVTLEEARTRLDLMASRLQNAYPGSNADRTYRILPSNRVTLDPDLDQILSLISVFLLVVVGLVLLLACTNLASFLLARGVERQREVAMRLALGAGRARLIRQILTETVLLGLAGGAAGLLIAQGVLTLFLAVRPPIPVPLNLDIGLDGTVLLFTLGASVLSGAVFGLAPALQTTRPELAPTLKGDTSHGRRKRRFHLQNALVGLQVAVSMVLLVGGSLFLRSLIAVQTTDPGFSTAEAGIAWLDLAGSEIPEETRETLWRDLKERILAQPGIRAVTAASRLPLSLSSDFTTFRIPGVEPPSGEEGFRLDVVYVDPGYFRTMGIPLLSGRSFSPADDASAPGVVMVNQAMANRFWPGESPVGKQLLAPHREEPLMVAGVVGNTSVQSLSESSVPVVYLPLAQTHHPHLQILARGDLPPAEVTRVLGEVIRQQYPHVLIMELKTMRQHLALRLFGPRAAASLLGIFGALALLLSSIGLYGVVSFSVSRRIREMGIRMSLGAARRDVLRLVVGRSMAVVAGGALVGLALAVGLARLIQGFLLGVSPTDPVTLLAVPLLLGATAFLAALIPALQGTRVSPVEALRRD